jgi:hypothetical protein
MKAQFNHALLIGGRLYAKGEHELDEKTMASPAMSLYFKSKYIVPAESGEVLKQETLEERNLRMAERLSVVPKEEEPKRAKKKA